MSDAPKASTTTRNLIAFVDFFGSFPSGAHYEARRKAECYSLELGDYRWIRDCYSPEAKRAPGGNLRFYTATAEGRELAKRSSLFKCLNWLAEQGFEYRPGSRSKAKRSYISGFSHDDGRTAWISQFSRVYVEERREQGEKWQAPMLAFEANNR